MPPALTEYVSTGDPPIVTRVVPEKFVPFIVIDVPAAPDVGVNEEIVGAPPTFTGVKLKIPPDETNSTV